MFFGGFNFKKNSLFLFVTAMGQGNVQGMGQNNSLMGQQQTPALVAQLQQRQMPQNQQGMMGQQQQYQHQPPPY